MFSPRILPVLILAGIMVFIMVYTWGSIGSAVMAMGLISMGSALLYRRFLDREDPDQWDNL